MDVGTSFKDLLPGLGAPRKIIDVDGKPAAIKSGRVSVADGETSVGAVLAEMSRLNPDFNISVLSALENLAMYHPDVSYAVENIVSLGNTHYNVVFNDTVSDKDAKEMTLHLRKKAKGWYAYSGGVRCLINDLLSQIAIFGCLSAEVVPSKSLDGVDKTVLVSPKHIKFRYDNAADKYIALQVGKRIVAGPSFDIVLNPVTYKYISYRRFSEKPYGIPPFLAACENIIIGKDMAENMKAVIKKLGVLGFLQVLVNAPRPNPGENSELYLARTKDHLNTVIPEVDAGLARGFITGYKDLHEVKMESTSQGVAGAAELVGMNDRKTFSGLKQDPLMFGQSVTTTETLGRVILAKMGTQIKNYQDIVASYLEMKFLMDLILSGYNVDELTVEFEPAMIGDKDKDATARGKEIDNAEKLYKAGIISQQQKAIELGYEKADQEEPRAEPVPVTEDDGSVGSKRTEPGNSPDETEGENQSRIITGGHLGAGRPEFPYHGNNCSCSDNKEYTMLLSRDRLSFDSTPSSLEDFIRLYFDASKKNFSKGIEKVTFKIAQALLELGTGAPFEAVRDKVFYHLYANWNPAFTQPQLKIVDKFVAESYEFFRKDPSVFAGKLPAGEIPKGTLNMVDRRAINYAKRSDSYYLGRFITDESTKKKITEHLQDQYLTRNLPIGGNKKAIKEFRSALGNTIELEDWKIAQIVDTTVSRMRNVAAVHYYEQALIERFEIVGVPDRLQCAYCAALQGKTFEISTVVQKLSEGHLSDPTLVKQDFPFITSLYKTADEVKSRTGEQLQNDGFSLVPAHPRCRDTVVAVI